MSNEQKRAIREPDTHGRTELPAGGYMSTRVARVRMVEGDMTLKVGEFERHTIYSDEGPRSGGEDRYPTPLGYIAMAVGF